MAKYAHQYPDVDQLFLEPNPDDAEMFFTSVFSYKSRRRVCNHAYRNTMNDLRRHKETLAPVLARHGLRFREEILEDSERSAFESLHAPSRRHTNTTARLRRALDDVESLLRVKRRPARRGRETQPRPPAS